METSSEEQKPPVVEENIGTDKDLFRALFFCVTAVFIVRCFVIEPFRIPSSSMVPTLRIGDHIFVSKFSYGLSIPFTKIQFASWGEPKRGDVIVFLWPRDESLHYVKRVIGLPGDRVEIRGKDILVNDKPIPKTKIDDIPVVEQVMESKSSDGELYKETLGEVVHFVRHSDRDSSGVGRRNFFEVVPPKHYFVMGDNRDDSSDSRSWGFVPVENIKGKAKIIWLSIDQEGGWSSAKKILWHRSAQLIN